MKNIVKALIPVAFALSVLTGCGGGGDATDFQDTFGTADPTPESISFSDDPLNNREWHFLKDPAYFYMHGIDENASINAGKYSNFTYTGSGVRVAILDTSFDVSHPDIAEGIAHTYDATNDDDNVSPSDGNDTHGTLVAGILGARLNNNEGGVGVAPDSELILIQGTIGTNISSLDIIKAFDDANSSGADIINCSWVASHISDSVRNKIIDLAKNGRDGKGTIIVFSIGNDNARIDDGAVAAIPEVITVGATNKYNTRTEYSNYGEALDVMAPGGEYMGIVSTDLVGNDGYADNSAEDPDYSYTGNSKIFIGTSAAASIVSGVTTLMLQANPDLTAAQVQQILKDTADKIGEKEYVNGHNDYYGYGKINMERAIDAALEM